MENLSGGGKKKHLKMKPIKNDLKKGKKPSKFE
jgi:hypothetical protein